jgi:hypothetical protein
MSVAPSILQSFPSLPQVYVNGLLLGHVLQVNPAPPVLYNPAVQVVQMVLDAHIQATPESPHLRRLLKFVLNLTTK